VSRPGRNLPPGKSRYQFYRRLGGPQGRTGRAENLVPTGILFNLFYSRKTWVQEHIVSVYITTVRMNTGTTLSMGTKMCRNYSRIRAECNSTFWDQYRPKHKGNMTANCIRQSFAHGSMSLPPILLNPLMPNFPYSGRTAPLTYKRCILYIYSTNTGTECFKNGIYSPYFSLQNAVCFIILIYLVPVLFTFYIQVC